jgi:hypothetical protein
MLGGVLVAQSGQLCSELGDAVTEGLGGGVDGLPCCLPVSLQIRESVLRDLDADLHVGEIGFQLAESLDVGPQLVRELDRGAALGFESTQPVFSFRLGRPRLGEQALQQLPCPSCLLACEGAAPGEKHLDVGIGEVDGDSRAERGGRGRDRPIFAEGEAHACVLQLADGKLGRTIDDDAFASPPAHLVHGDEEIVAEPYATAQLVATFLGERLHDRLGQRTAPQDYLVEGGDFGDREIPENPGIAPFRHHEERGGRLVGAVRRQDRPQDRREGNDEEPTDHEPPAVRHDAAQETDVIDRCVCLLHHLIPLRKALRLIGNHLKRPSGSPVMCDVITSVNARSAPGHSQIGRSATGPISEKPKTMRANRRRTLQAGIIPIRLPS